MLYALYVYFLSCETSSLSADLFSCICRHTPSTFMEFLFSHNGCNPCWSCHPRIARHIRIPTIKAAINPTIPMIMSQFEPLLLLRIFFGNMRLIFKRHSKILCDINEWVFAAPVVILRRMEHSQL